LQATVQRITVTELRANTFYAIVLLESEGRLVEIDSRPSDAIALALRTKAPIFVAEKVLDSAGHKDPRQKKEESDKWIDDLFDKLNRRTSSRKCSSSPAPIPGPKALSAGETSLMPNSNSPFLTWTAP